VIVAAVRDMCVELGLESFIAFAAVVFGEADFTAFFAAIADEFVDALFSLWVDDECHIVLCEECILHADCYSICSGAAVTAV
jgi:hypothetical protein